jgi:rhamnogalacturonyl hydrolase YesR
MNPLRARAVFALVILSATFASAQGRRETGPIDPQTVSHEQGFCYTVPLQAPCKPDSNAGQASFLRLYEDGKELGPAHSMHQSIRDTGGGAYSHWSGTPDGPQQLYFCASDNSDPRTNGRKYEWAVVYDATGKPVPPTVAMPITSPCRLATVPDQPAVRDRKTCLLASFDSADTSDAEYARVERREVGTGTQADAPGRFGGGVAVTGTQGCVMYPGLDNYDPRRGTVEFWAQSRAEAPIWTDGKEHWLLVLYPERAGASPRYGMAPYFVVLRKMADNTLDLRVVNASLPPYAAAVSLRTARGWSVSMPADTLSPDAWHHLVASWDLEGAGRVWLLVDGQGVAAELGLPTNHLPPNPGGLIVFGGIWGLPGDGVESSTCNLDDLRIQACTVAARLEGATAQPDQGLDEARLMADEDLARAMLDQLLKLQFHGGWGASYHWPTYTPSGWGFIGRGVDMWFPHSAEAGQALLRGWMLWGDDRYLDGAIEAADMFCETQMENGSWAYHYTYSRGEFQRWGDHAYIAQSMQSNQIRFLCLMSRRLGYERYGQAIRKAGDWMASIQFPSGAWGWEAYPLGQTGPYGHPALNDAITPQAMHDLFVIWCATGDDKYLQPILRGAEWIVEAQADAPTYGWADQYNEKNEFIWMRNFEPPAVSMQAISSATWGLCLAYDLSGDAKYLEPLKKVVQWMDTVPEDQRGWLWYDPATSGPVVAYNNVMLPVTDPKAIAEMIPRLDAHYGTKYPWQAERIREELRRREKGPIYIDWRGVRSRADFAQAPTIEEFAAAFQADRGKDARAQIQAWAEGKPLGGILGGSVSDGRTFEVGNAIRYCEQLLTESETGRVGFGDLPVESVPRYYRGGSNNWVYMEPQRDYLATPLSATGGG